jgi:hypothetical protein
MPSLLPDECETIDATFWAIQCKRCIYVRSNSVVICGCLFCYLNPIIDSSLSILDSDKADIIYWYVGLNWTIVDGCNRRAERVLSDGQQRAGGAERACATVCLPGVCACADGCLPAAGVWGM